MRALEALEEHRKGIRGVLTDVDGTLTHGGRLEEEAYAGLWALKARGLRVVVVTGRPAGWCDLMSRQWPVDAVIGENGAFATWVEGGRQHELLHPAADVDAPARLTKLRERILGEIPEARVARDQAYRRFDLAIDFAEDEPRLGLDTAERIKAVFEDEGAVAKISDIHVNGWFGDYDKLSMASLLVERLWDVSEQSLRSDYIYCGDSPNDEPFFEAFEHSVGVANIRAFEKNLSSMPAYVTSLSGGRGFGQLAALLCA